MTLVEELIINSQVYNNIITFGNYLLNSRIGASLLFYYTSILPINLCLVAVASRQESEAISLSLSREVIYCYRNHGSNLETNANCHANVLHSQDLLKDSATRSLATAVRIIHLYSQSLLVTVWFGDKITAWNGGNGYSVGLVWGVHNGLR